MQLRTAAIALLALAGHLTVSGVAHAQPGACERYQAELAALPRGGGRQASAAADRQRAEIGRLQNYYRSIGCERGPFGGFFGSTPSECPAIGQRIRQMEANYAQLLQQADGSEFEGRRRQLQAAIAQSCGAPQQVERPRNFLEQLFGVPRQQAAPQPQPEYLEEEERALGGRKLACVRSCDGYAFPLSNAPNGRESADEMCQALCPGTETTAYAMPGGDDALNQAISIRTNRPYVQSPNAFKFQKSFDPSCSCKKQGETWAQLLRQAEGMLDQRRGDIIVTEQKAEELSRPKAAPPLTPAQQREQERRLASRKATDAAEAQAAAEAGAAAPTATSESSGIGRTIEGARVIARTEGERREIAGPDGGKRTVRVIATNVIPVPQTAAR
jgi:hypothetical protein